MNDRRLVSIVLGFLVIGFSIYVWSTGQPSNRLEPFAQKSLEISVLPLAPGVPEEDSETSTSAVTGPGGVVGIYLDVSEPMAGYLAPIDDGEATGLQMVAQLVPDHLLTLFGPVQRLEWLEFDRVVHPARLEPRFRRRDFRGSETFLDQAIEHGLGRIESGESEVFAVVSDLVATRSVTGAVGLFTALEPWLQSPAVRSGTHDLGLLAVRLPFRGVANGKCPAQPPLGCWFSERSPGWRPLSEEVSRPLYVLLLGRAGRDAAVTSATTSLVQQVGTALSQDLSSLGLESQWQLLTAGWRHRSGSLDCHGKTGPGDSTGRQLTLRHGADGAFRCLQEEKVWIDCRLTVDGRTLELRDSEVETSWGMPWVTARIDGSGGLEIAIDCGAIQQSPPDGALELRGMAAVADGDSRQWHEWSVESDHREDQLDRTLQLRHFVDATQPRGYAVKVFEPLLGRTEGPHRP